MPILSKVAVPFTPTVRRFLADVFKPSTLRTLGKRGRGQNYHGEHPSQGHLQFPGPAAGHLPNCVALQNDDMDEDAVVITALNIVPFCCHADLLTMTRDDLVRVADILNLKLPQAMQIDTSAPRSDVFIRNSIELLVGIRRTVPPAPKPNRSMNFVVVASPRHDGGAVDDKVPPSPASPLANRSNKLHTFSFVHSPPLAALDEEDEDKEMEEFGVVEPERPLKKRRRIIHDSGSVNATPSPTTRALLGRSQSQRTPRSNINSPFQMGPSKVFRSQSQKLPQRKAVNAYRNITLTRGRGGVRTRPSGRSQSAIILTSTPKERKRIQDHVSESTDSFAEPLSSISFPSPPAPSPIDYSSANPGRNLKRKAIDQDAADVTVGLEGMSMADEGSASDMDISLE